jgi:hypothetical protein
MTLPRVLRGIAVAIVLLALLDPVLTTDRRSDTVVAIVPAAGAFGGAESPDFRAGSLEGEVAASVGRSMHAVRGPWTGASATVLVGEGWPASANDLPRPVFRVLPRGAADRDRIVAVELPFRSPGQARVPVEVLVEAPGGPPGDVEIRSGELLLDRATPAPTGVPGFVRASLEFVPPSGEPLVVDVGLVGPGGPVAPAAAVRRVLVVEDVRWPVLFFDPRPNWGSTFVRRALEEDPRFELAGRVETSPGLATTFGDSPGSLTAPGALDRFDVVVVGAPDGLDGAQTAALERWAQDRGGTVVLLPDRLDPGASAGEPWMALAQVGAWERATGDAELPVDRAAAPDDPALPLLLTRERAWPRALPPGASVLAADPAGAPLVWQRPLGSGAVIVSGALDAWRFRDPVRSRFESGWRELLAEAAAAAPPPLELRLVPGRSSDAASGNGAGGALRPAGPAGLAVQAGAPVHLVATPRAGGRGAQEPAAPLELRAVASLEQDPAGTATPAAPIGIPIWPGPAVGTIVADFRAPAEPGTHRVRVEVDGESASVPLVVVEGPTPVQPGSDRPILEAWITSRGGALVPADELERLVPAIEAAVGAERRPEPWYPMRSAWWLLPFALALAGEWWWRRRRGLP